MSVTFCNRIHSQQTSELSFANKQPKKYILKTVSFRYFLVLPLTLSKTWDSSPSDVPLYCFNYGYSNLLGCIFFCWINSKKNSVNISWDSCILNISHGSTANLACVLANSYKSSVCVDDIWSGIQKLQYLVFLDRSPGRLQGFTHLPATAAVTYTHPSPVFRGCTEPVCEAARGIARIISGIFSFHPRSLTSLESAEGNSLLQLCHCQDWTKGLCTRGADTVT